MFCGNCGNPVEGTKFCTKCGSPVDGSRPASTIPRSPTAPNERCIKSGIPEIKSPFAVHKKAKMGAYFAGDLPPPDYSWLTKIVDVVLAPNVIIVVSASPVNRFTVAADNVGLLGQVGGLAGAAVVTLPAVLIGAAYEKCFGKHNQFDKPSLQALFDSGNAIWIDTSLAQFHLIETKGGFFGDVGCLYAVIGDFETASGKLKMCFTGSDNVYKSVSEVRKAFDTPRYKFKHSTVKKNGEDLLALDELLMETFPGTPARFANQLKWL